MNTTQECYQSDAYELAVAIAPHMTDRFAARGRVWDGERSKDYASLVRADGLEFSVSTRSHAMPGRVTFRGCYPDLEPGFTYSARDYFEITCDAGKDRKKLAREVERRLLAAGFETAWREAREYVASWKKQQRATREAAERIACATGLTISDRSGERGNAIEFYRTPNSISRLQVQQPGVSDSEGPRVRFEIYGIDEETATRVLRILAGKDDK
jgi:hypothetical protein